MQLRPSAVEISSNLFDRSEESTSFNYLLVSVCEIPSDDDAGLTAANDPPGIKLEFEYSSHVSRLVVMRNMVMVVTGRLSCC